MKKQSWNRNSFYYRVSISLSVMAIISLVLVFSFFYPQILNSARNRVEDQRAHAMQQTVEAMDVVFDQMNSIASIIERDATLRPYFIQSGGTLALYEAKERMRQYTSTQSELCAMFYYVDGMDRVIGNIGVASLDNFNKSVWKLDNLNQDELIEMLRSLNEKQYILLPQDVLRLSLGDSGNNVLPFLISISNSQKHYASLMVLFDANDVAMELKRSWNDDTLFITDGSRILFSTDPEKTQFLQPEQLAASNDGEELSDGSMLYLSPSTRYKFTYGAVCYPDVLQRELESLSRTALLFMLFALLGILLFARILSRWNYKPVQEFCVDIGVDLSAKRSDSELLREHFRTLMSTNAQLAENLKHSQKMLEDAIVQRLLVSTPQERNVVIERGKNAGLFSASCMCTVAISPDNGEFASAMASRTEPFRIFALHQVAGGGHTVLLILHSCSDSPEKELLQALSSEAESRTICYSPLCRSWQEIPEAYALLLKRLHSLIGIGEAGLVSWDDPRLEGESEAPFGAEALKELSDSLRDQSEDGLRFALSHLCAFLNERSRAISELQALTVEALQIICDALSVQGRLSAKILDQMNPLAQGRLDDPKRMESLLHRAVELAMEGFPKPDRASGKQLSQDVLLYIEENLLDPNFSIYTISEAFGISESAFSHLFKRTFQQNFSSYVNQQKLIRAFDLLCDENIPLEEVALRLGYSRASNFGRMFKAEVGMSPGKYRSMYAKKREDQEDPS